MNKQLIDGGRIHTPFSIFIRQPHAYSDKELLSLFGLPDYRRTDVTNHGRRAIFADAGQWTVMCDDWYYTLWHMSSTQQVIEKIAKWHDLFACSEGDCDRSFDYQYFVNGETVRKYVVASPRYSDRKILTDHGAKLPGEDALLSMDGYNIGIAIAESLGIKTRFEVGDLRVFAPSSGNGRKVGAS